MEMLKLFSEAKANGLSKEEFFHLLELELKMNESKKQASGGIMSSGDGLGSGAAGLEQLLRETCEKIKNQQKQMLALQNELQKHNLQGKSELSRGAEGRFDSAPLDMKDKFHEMRNTVLNRLEEEKSFMREALSKAHNDIPTLLSKTGQEVNQIKEVLGADEIAQIGKQVSQIRLLCEEQGQQKGPQDNKDDGSASSQSAGAFDDMEEVKSGYHKPKPQGSTEGAPILKAFFDQLGVSEDVRAKMKAQEERERREAREKKEREEQERLRKSAGAFDDMEEVKSGYQKPKPQASTEGAPNLKAFFDQLLESEDVKAKMKAQEAKKEAREKKEREEQERLRKSAGAFDDMEEVKSGYQKPKPQGSTEGAPNLKAFFDQLGESEDVKAKMKAQQERERREAREKKEREEQERLRKSAGAFDDMEEVKSGYQKPKPQASTEGAPNLKAFFDQLFESEDVKAKMKAQEAKKEAREKKEREEQERLRKSAGAFDDMEEVKSGYQKPKPQASTEGAPNLKAFFDQLFESEDVKAKMKAQEAKKEAREKKEREEQERLRKSAGAFDDMEEVKSGYQKPKPQASTEGAPILKAFFDQLGVSEDVKAKMKAQEERERREAREKKEREEQERLRKSAGAFDDMEEVKSGYQKPKPQASTEGAPNLKAFFDQLGVSEDVKAKMKAQEERERREAREKKEREEQERLRKSAGAFDDMEEVKSGYQKPKPQASTEGAPNLKAFFDQLFESEDVKAKMKAQEAKKEAREKKEREEQERLRKVDVGWWRGQCRGVTGVFPANYVELQQ